MLDAKSRDDADIFYNKAKDLSERVKKLYEDINLCLSKYEKCAEWSDYYKLFTRFTSIFLYFMETQSLLMNDYSAIYFEKSNPEIIKSFHEEDMKEIAGYLEENTYLMYNNAILYGKNISTP